jgi:hypothetical protein
LFFTRADKIVAAAEQLAIPAMYFRREFALAGGLMSYECARLAEGVEHPELKLYLANLAASWTKVAAETVEAQLAGLIPPLI